ncbi:hypothetical protein ACFL2S_03175 [Thermodesulfobacteriota bacterium]
MIRTQIKIDGLEFEIDQGSHVHFKDDIGDIVYSAWDDLDATAKKEIKNIIVKAENLIRLSANTIWN